MKKHTLNPLVGYAFALSIFPVAIISIITTTAVSHINGYDQDNIINNDSIKILSNRVDTIYMTNMIVISCEEAGCTNWYEFTYTEVGDIVLEPELTNRGVKLNKVKVCPMMHLKEVVVPIVEVETITFGSDNKPIYDMVTYTVTSNIVNCYDIYSEGTYIKRRN